jgi:hypothetical protein
MSWKPEVYVQGAWSKNGLRFATEKEAVANAHNLMMRWTLVEDYRAVEASEPVNYRWTSEGHLEAVT